MVFSQNYKHPHVPWIMICMFLDLGKFWEGYLLKWSPNFYSSIILVYELKFSFQQSFTFSFGIKTVPLLKMINITIKLKGKTVHIKLKYGPSSPFPWLPWGPALPPAPFDSYDVARPYPSNFPWLSDPSKTGFSILVFLTQLTAPITPSEASMRFTATWLVATAASTTFT